MVAVQAVAPKDGHGAEWHHGICGCMQQCDICCTGFWCPCILFGENAKKIDGDEGCFFPCCIFTLLASLGCACCVQTPTRKRLRAKYQLKTSPCNDCLTTFCCGPCALCQEAQEYKYRASLTTQNGIKDMHAPPQQAMHTDSQPTTPKYPQPTTPTHSQRSTFAPSQQPTTPTHSQRSTFAPYQPPTTPTHSQRSTFAPYQPPTTPTHSQRSTFAPYQPSTPTHSQQSAHAPLQPIAVTTLGTSGAAAQPIPYQPYLQTI